MAENPVAPRTAKSSDVGMLFLIGTASCKRSADRAAACLGENRVNIDYSYCGLEPGSSQVLLVFGVDDLTKAATALDALAAKNP